MDGVAQLRVVEIPASAPAANANATKDGKDGKSETSAPIVPKTKKVVVNLTPDATEYTHQVSKVLKKYAHMKVQRGNKIMGPFLQPMKGTHGTAATITVQEGMWEDKRGHKVDGGERRQKEVRAKLRLEERRKA